LFKGHLGANVSWGLGARRGPGLIEVGCTPYVNMKNIFIIARSKHENDEILKSHISKSYYLSNYMISKFCVKNTTLKF